MTLRLRDVGHAKPKLGTGCEAGRAADRQAARCARRLVQNEAQRSPVGDVERRDRRVLHHAECALLNRHGKTGRIGQLARERRGAADDEDVGAAPEVDRTVKDRRARRHDRIRAGAEGKLALCLGIARQDEVIIACAERDVAAQRAVGDIQRVAASSKPDIAVDLRRQEAGGDRRLLDGCASRVGAKVDRDITGRGCIRARGGDRAAILYEGESAGSVDDGRCGTGRPADRCLDLAAVAQDGESRAGIDIDGNCAGGSGRAARRDDLSSIAKLRRRGTRAQLDGGGDSVERLGTDGAVDPNPVGDGDRAAQPADLHAVAVDAGVEAVTADRPVDDQAEAGAGPDRGADVDRAGRADP